MSIFTWLEDDAPYAAKGISVSKMASNLRECAKIAQLNGVKIGIQNHGDMLRTSDQVLQMLDMVDSDSLGVINDTGLPDSVVPNAVQLQLQRRRTRVSAPHGAWLRIKFNFKGGGRGRPPHINLYVL